jgi:hypothetical protein
MGGAALGEGRKEGRKILLFLKKKKQKDFYLLVARNLPTPHPGGPFAPAAQRLQKSFCFFFFRKRRLFLTPATPWPLA